MYELNRHDIEYSRYLLEEGYSIIPMTNQMQQDYGCNCLSLGDGLCLMVRHRARIVFCVLLLCVCFDVLNVCWLALSVFRSICRQRSESPRLPNFTDALFMFRSASWLTCKTIGVFMSQFQFHRSQQLIVYFLFTSPLVYCRVLCLFPCCLLGTAPCIVVRKC